MDYHRQPNAALRPLPSVMPEFIAVELNWNMFRGQQQWVSAYKLYDNGNSSDYIEIVVNVNHRRLSEQPEEGELWWVKPTNMAPQKRLVFAEAVERVYSRTRPLPVRMGDELLLDFWSSDGEEHSALHEGWKVVMRNPYICRKESWRVQVAEIRLASATIVVRAVGPDPKAAYRPPEKVGYIGITPLYATRRKVIETEVLSYGRRSDNSISVEIEHEGRISRLTCSTLRRYGRQLIAWITPDREPSYLAEVVLIEGEPLGRPAQSLPVPPPPPIYRRPAPVYHAPAYSEWDDDDGMEEYLRECRENEEPPDRDF